MNTQPYIIFYTILAVLCVSVVGMRAFSGAQSSTYSQDIAAKEQHKIALLKTQRELYASATQRSSARTMAQIASQEGYENLRRPVYVAAPITTVALSSVR